MKVIFINPFTKRFFWSDSYLPALGLPLLAAITPNDVEVSIVDEAQGRIKELPEADLVGITTLTATAKRAYEIADSYRAAGVPVVLGGVHVSAVPQEGLQHADAVALGEGEEIWPLVLSDYQAGDLRQIYHLPARPKLDTQPAPRWDLLKSNNTRGAASTIYSVQAGRGCPSKCDFCNVPVMFGRSFRMRPVSEIVTEISEISQTPFLLIDDNILANLQFAKQLLGAIAPLGKDWMGLASLTNLYDQETVELLSTSGCKYLFIGFESINGENLRDIGKKINKPEKYREILESLNQNGIEVIGSFIVGLDHDDEGVFEEIYDFVVDSQMFVPIVNILTPYPGTRVYARLKEEGRILTDDWSRYATDEVVFQPRNMTPETLQTRYTELMMEFSRIRSENLSRNTGNKGGYSIRDF